MNKRITRIAAAAALVLSFVAGVYAGRGGRDDVPRPHAYSTLRPGVEPQTWISRPAAEGHKHPRRAQ